MKYPTIVVDPPWPTMGGPLTVGVGEGWQFRGAEVSRPLPYQTMSTAELAMPYIFATEAG